MMPTVTEPSAPSPTLSRERTFSCRADAYGLRFPDAGGFTAAGLTFIRWSRFKQHMNAFVEVGDHPTGEVRFAVHSTGWISALHGTSNEILGLTSQLLTFAQNRAVKFRELVLVGNDHILRYPDRSRALSSSYGQPRIPIQATGAFLEHSVPITMSASFRDSNGVIEAIQLANETCFSVPATGTRFLLQWLALEALVNGAKLDDGANASGQVLDRQELKELRAEVSRWSAAKGFDDAKASALWRAMGSARSLSIVDRAVAFAAAQGLSLDPKRIVRINEIRNALSHSPWDSPDEYHEEYVELSQIVDALVFSSLGFNPDARGRRRDA